MVAKVFAAFANGVWFKAVRAEANGHDPFDDESDERRMCKGCIFDKTNAAACMAAGEAAKAAGLPDCESRGMDPGYLYVRDPSDGRQLDVVESSL
jgi:hypothetical protein